MLPVQIRLMQTDSTVRKSAVVPLTIIGCRQIDFLYTDSRFLDETVAAFESVIVVFHLKELRVKI